jgi:hypothetical protein
METVGNVKTIHLYSFGIYGSKSQYSMVYCNKRRIIHRHAALTREKVTCDKCTAIHGMYLLQQLNRNKQYNTWTAAQINVKGSVKEEAIVTKITEMILNKSEKCDDVATQRTP